MLGAGSCPQSPSAPHSSLADSSWLKQVAIEKGSSINSNVPACHVQTAVFVFWYTTAFRIKVVVKISMTASFSKRRIGVDLVSVWFLLALQYYVQRDVGAWEEGANGQNHLQMCRMPHVLMHATKQWRPVLPFPSFQWKGATKLSWTQWKDCSSQWHKEVNVDLLWLCPLTMGVLC